MKNDSAVLFCGLVIAAIVIWAVLKDKDEVFFSIALPGGGTVSAGGRNRSSFNIASSQPLSLDRTLTA